MSGQTFFLHGPGGIVKNLCLQHSLLSPRGQGKIVVCVASSGIASICNWWSNFSHSTFKIPSKSMKIIMQHCKNTDWQSSFVPLIWLSGMKHQCSIVISWGCGSHFKTSAMWRTNFWRSDCGLWRRFQTILPVIVKVMSSNWWEQYQRSQLWRDSRFQAHREHVFKQPYSREVILQSGNWRLVMEAHRWDRTIRLLIIQCTENTILLWSTPSTWINNSSSSWWILCQAYHPHQSNDDVDNMNNQMLREFPGEERLFMSADSAKHNAENGEMQVNRFYHLSLKAWTVGI